MQAAIEDAVSREETLYRDNLRLGELEFQRQHLYLRSFPRCLGLVLGNQCNIDCPHCYQAKNGDNLLKPADIGSELRREFQAFYPYLSTLRVQGGEAFAYTAFADLIEDVASAVRRPILSASTNGTLIDERWAERIVRTPFRNLTVSVDGGTPATYARLRRGAQLAEVLGNVARIQRWKRKLASEMPYIDSFFVVMRSNFRELPEYLRMVAASGFSAVSLQTPEINRENSSREPTLARDEVIADAAEVRELHGLLTSLLPVERRRFTIRTSGFTSLFQQHGLSTAFLREESEGLYPDSQGLIQLRVAAEALKTATPAQNGIPLCPNPWTTLFIAESGDVHLCFLSEPIGNLYQAPLISIWNSPSALAKRSHMIAGRYVASGCSPRWCSWRDGRQAAALPAAEIQAGIAEMRQLARRAEDRMPPATIDDRSTGIAAVRRVLTARERTISELQAMFRQLCETNQEMHEAARAHIAHLEAKASKAVADFEGLQEEVRRHSRTIHEAACTHIAHLEAKASDAVADFEGLQKDVRQFRSWPIIRLALAVVRCGRWFTAPLRRRRGKTV
jgi:MoaA/NifB/PqqE/SkfB family radical SAM enzyme